jgi:hypothetical protein
MLQLALGAVFAVKLAMDPFAIVLVTDIISNAPDPEGGLVAAITAGKRGDALTPP